MINSARFFNKMVTSFLIQFGNDTNFLNLYANIETSFDSDKILKTLSINSSSFFSKI